MLLNFTMSSSPRSPNHLLVPVHAYWLDNWFVYIIVDTVADDALELFVGCEVDHGGGDGENQGGAQTRPQRRHTLRP